MIVLLLLVGLAVNAGLARVPAPMRARRRLGVAALVVACLAPLVALHVGGGQRRRTGRLDRRPRRRARERDRHRAGAGRRAADGRLVHARQVLARGRPRVRRPARRSASAPAPSRSPGCATARTPRAPATPTASSSRRSPTSGIVGARAVARAARCLARGRAADHRPASAPAAVPRTGPAPLAAPRLGPASGSRSSRSALVAVAFGLQSAIDWTWFVPGPDRDGARGGRLRGRARARGARSRSRAPRPMPRGAPALDAGRAAAAAGVGAGRAARRLGDLAAGGVATAPSTERARALATEGRYEEACAKTRGRRRRQPALARPAARPRARSQAGRRARAPRRTRTLGARRAQVPRRPEHLARLARFQLVTLDRPRQALETLRGALYLDPYSPRARHALPRRPLRRARAARARSPG